jgi:ParB-like chromosome segregation protein Spo0J
MARIAVRDLEPNPFRSLERYPINRDKVEALKASIQSTEFWDNLLARKNGKGYEIAYGHHRLVALQELKTKEIDIPVRDLDDETMLRIIANENMEEWSASALIEQETIRATVQAFAEGKVELPKVDMLTTTMTFVGTRSLTSARIHSADGYSDDRRDHHAGDRGARCGGGDQLTGHRR